MNDLFLIVLNMSLTGSYIILVVLLARLILKKAPKIFSYALWAVVLFRLLCPLTIESAFSLLPAVQVTDVPGLGDAPAQVIQVQTGVPTVDRQVNDFFLRHPYQGLPDLPEYAELPPQEPSRPIQQTDSTSSDWRTAPAMIWLAGAALLLGYSAASLLRLRRRLVGTLPLEGDRDVLLADHIPSPFVLGLVRPKIYLPSDLPEGERDYILLHERTHIRRGDHVLRALAWLAVVLHWFNPLVWLAFHLAGKDMEMSCDEAVLRRMGRDVRADYSSSLLRLSAGKRLPAGPLAFGAGDPRSRIKNVLSYQKPALWVVVLALIGVVCAGAALATNPGAASGPGKPADFVSQEPGPAECWLDYGSGLEEMPWDGSAVELPEFPSVTFRWTSGTVSAVTQDGKIELMGGMPIYSVYLCDLNGDGCRELCAASYWGSGLIDARIQVYDYQHLGLHTLEDRGVRDYSLQLEGDRLWAVEREYPGGQVLRAGPLMMTEEGLDIQNEFTGIVLPSAELTFSLEEYDDGDIVRMEGSVDGVALKRNAVWWAQGLELFFGGQSGGGVAMSWEFFPGGWAEVNAWWADEGHTSVTLSTQMSAMFSSLMNTGWWEFTVNLSQDGGTVTEMVNLPSPVQTGSNVETHYYPKAISDEEAVRAARVAAKLLTAAEDYYHSATRVQDAAAFLPAE